VVEQFQPNIITTALAAATIAKILVDLVRSAQQVPAWASPVMALVGAEIAALLLLVSSGAALTPQTLAQAAIAGMLAAGTAVGATELQRREKRDPQAILGALLDAPVATEPRQGG